MTASERALAAGWTETGSGNWWRPVRPGETNDQRVVIDRNVWAASADEALNIDERKTR